MSELGDLLDFLFNLFFPKSDDNYNDRLHVFTSNGLIAASLLVSWKSFRLESAIECMPPAMFPDSWVTVRKSKLFVVVVALFWVSFGPPIVVKCVCTIERLVRLLLS